MYIDTECHVKKRVYNFAKFKEQILAMISENNLSCVVLKNESKNKRSTRNSLSYFTGGNIL